MAAPSDLPRLYDPLAPSPRSQPKGQHCDSDDNATVYASEFRRQHTQGQTHDAARAWSRLAPSELACVSCCHEKIIFTRLRYIAPAGFINLELARAPLVHVLGCIGLEHGGGSIGHCACIE